MPFATATDGSRPWFDALGEGNPVVLLSGQSLDHRMWIGLAEELAQDLQVVLVDNRGTGSSELGDLRENPLSTTLFADDVVAVLDELGLARASVYGFSMGGRIAQQLAVTHPDRVDRLVLSATGPGGPHQAKRPRSADQALLGGNTEAGRAALVDLFFSREFASQRGDLVDVILPSTTRESMRAHFAASAGHDAWALLPSIEAPTLVMHGDADQLTPPDNARILADRIPDSRIALIADGRHGYLHEFALQVTPFAADFLA